MFVCICNALRESQIADAARVGATTVDQAYAVCGANVQCGHCREDAEALIGQICEHSCSIMQAAE